VGDGHSVAVAQVVPVNGQIQFLLAGQLGQHLVLVFGSDVQEGLKTVGVLGPVQHVQLQADEGCRGHPDKLSLAAVRFVSKALDVGVRGVADVDDGLFGFHGQAAITVLLEHFADRLG
jgi:hypothetical protein